MKLINPYISFNGKCREAMTFYHQILGGKLDLMEVAGSPIEDSCPPAMKDHILNSFLTLPNGTVLLMASDMTGPWGHVEGNNISLCVHCTSEEEINHIYSKLLEGGEILDPLGIKFWGDLFGVFKDKFGIHWIVNYNKNQ